MQRFITRLAKLASPLVAWLTRGNSSAGAPDIQVFAADDAELASATVHTGSILNGAPATRWLTRITAPDGHFASGVWDSTAGRHELTFACDELVHILEGEVHVRIGGSVRTLRVGDVAFFEEGLRCTWDVPKYVRKVWVHRYHRPGLVHRSVRRIENLLRKVS